MIKNFIFNDIVLYAKYWYQRKNIIEDLGYLFSKIYGCVEKTETDIAFHMLHVLDILYKEIDAPRDSYRFLNNHLYFEQEVRKYMSLYNISRDMAIIRIALGILQYLSKDEICLNAPHYGKKEYFRMGMMFGKYPISQTYAEMNRIAQKTFNYN